MLYSCSKIIIDLQNKYALKTFFVLNRITLESLNNLNAIIVAPIKSRNPDEINLDTLYVSSDSITFHLKIEDMVWYKVICSYQHDSITNVSEYFRKYSEFEDCWTEMYDYENNNLINEYRNNIKALVQTCFKKITTLYRATDSDMIEYPWFFKFMKSFEQTLSFRTQIYVKKYVNSIRSQLLYKKYYDSKLLRRMLHNWKERYYCPENNDGYLKKLRTGYEIYLSMEGPKISNRD